MENKIMQVFYGNDCLPYKDKERQVHYPIVGNAFLGASDTTKIRFYFDRIGNTATTWVAVAKLPNGKQGSQVLSVAEDSELGENYAELTLNSWFTQAKGDVFIALQGYQGGVQYSYDDESGLYTITGTPIIRVTGSIKLAINYAPIGDSPDYTDEFTTYQEILSALGDKANIVDTIYVVSNISTLYASEYEEGQVLLNKADYSLYIVNSGEFVLWFYTYNKDYIDTELGKKVDKTTATNKLYGTDYSGNQTTLTYSIGTNGSTIPQRLSYGGIAVPATPTNDTDATSKKYVDDGLATKQASLVSGTNIKTINQQSLLGSGNITIREGAGAWGEITGDIQDQTDLQAEFNDVRAEIAGRSQNISISYSALPPITDAEAINFKKFDGTHFTDLADFNSYVSGLTLANQRFYSVNDDVVIYEGAYLIDLGKKVIKTIDIRDYYSVGNTNLFVYEHNYSTNVPLPDRWYSKREDVDDIDFNLYFSALESKVDVSGLATTGDLSMARYETELMLAPEYNIFTTYAVGDKVVYNHKLYTCTTAIDTPESWDATHWTQISVASGFVDLDKAQVITGKKTLNKQLDFTNESSNTITYNLEQNSAGQFVISRTYSGTKTAYWKIDTNKLLPNTNNTNDIGSSSSTIKDLYLSGSLISSGAVTFKANGVNDNTLYITTAETYLRSNFRPFSSNAFDLGTSAYNWRNLYLSGAIKGLPTITQTEYDNMATHDADTFYFIEEE